MLKNILEWYFVPKFFEKSGTAYRLLGVHKFNKLLRSYRHCVILLTQKKIIKRIHWDAHTLKEYNRLNKELEILHLFGGLFALCLTPFLPNSFIPLFFIANLIVNFYPILIQRYNRTRINRILKKQKFFRDF